MVYMLLLQHRDKETCYVLDLPGLADALNECLMDSAIAMYWQGRNVRVKNRLVIAFCLLFLVLVWIDYFGGFLFFIFEVATICSSKCPNEQHSILRREIVCTFGSKSLHHCQHVHLGEKALK